MLKALRKKKNVKKYLIWLIMLILPAFVLWGVSTVRTSGGYVVRMLGKSINKPQFIKYLEDTRLSIMFKIGKEFYKKKPEEIRRETIQRILLIMDAKRKGLKVKQEELISYLKNIPYFQDQDGQFNKDLYFRIVRGFFRTEPFRFEKMLKNQILIDKLYNLVTADIDIKDEEILKAYTQENEKVKIQYVRVSPELFKERIKPAKSSLKRYYTRRREEYRVPPRVKIRFIKIPLETDPGILKRTLRYKKLEEIANFLNLPILESDYFSLNEPIKFIGWEKRINTLAFNLEGQRPSQPITTSEAIYIIERIDKKASYIPPFEEIEDKIREDFITKKSEKMAYFLAKNIAEELNKNKRELLKNSNSRIEDTDFFTRTDYVEGLGRGDEIFTFVDNNKRWLGPQKIGNNFYIFKLIEKREIDKEEFEKNKEELRKNYLRIKKNFKFLSYFTKLLQEAKIKLSEELALSPPPPSI